jgi:flagellin
MAFDINTNIASLQAQNYLRTTSTFQSQTINEVTSGLRIVNSGDDAAGLAIANGYRSSEAVLTQGVANANDGLSQLQIADGGISNISQLLDRARTLATQSATGTFTGDRGVLNSEFQSVLGEIDRQAQAIGLNQGGEFAKNLSVFIGGGETSGTVSASQNGSIELNLSNATVDSKSLGLEGVQAGTAPTVDLGTGSATSVQNIVTNATNLNSITNNTTTFSFTGPGFSDTSGNNTVKIQVNLTGVTDTGTLVTAINQAIQNAGNGASQQATAFKNANITAAIATGTNNTQQLTFNSATTAFQIQGSDKVSTALLGDIVGSTPVGNSAAVTAAAGQAYAAPAANETVNLRILGAGLNGAPANDLSVALPTTVTTADEAVTAINTAIAANTAVAATGIQAVNNGGTIQLQGKAGQTFEVQAAGDVSNALGFGSYVNSAGEAGGAGNFNYSTLTAAGASTANTQGLQISVNGGAAVDLGVLTSSATETTAIAVLNAAFQGNATTRAAGLEAKDNGGGDITIDSSSGQNIRLNFYGGTGDAFGFGASAVGSAVGAAGKASTYTAQDSVNSLGAQQSHNASGTDVYQFTGLRAAGDAQTVTLTAVDAGGNQHTLNVALTTANANNLDQAVGTINQAILASNDATLKNIVALKQDNNGNTAEGVRFLDATGTFSVSLGASPNSVGIADGSTHVTGGPILSSASNGTGSTADISNVTTATAAVTALGTAVTILGTAQATVGRGENQLNYAINLASSQLTNQSSAEAQIRDADLATEAANLTKVSIQLQAGIAALAQANSAPQAVLKLLQ